LQRELEKAATPGLFLTPSDLHHIGFGELAHFEKLPPAEKGRDGKFKRTKRSGGEPFERICVLMPPELVGGRPGNRRLSDFLPLLSRARWVNPICANAHIRPSK
jgi:hypothetical protein